MADDGVILDSEDETATELRVSVATLRRWRRRKIGPKPTHVGRQVFYRRRAKLEWLTSQEGWRSRP
jgi:DNA-binding transcriptional MerR regulator